MGNCEEVLMKHGEGIKIINPNLNETTPFVRNDPSQWRSLGNFLENINREIQQNNIEDVPRQTSYTCTANKREDED